MKYLIVLLLGWLRYNFSSVKYLLILLLLAGSVWGDCDIHKEINSAWGVDESHYLDTVEVCDTVWYFRHCNCYVKQLGHQWGCKSVDSIPKITTRKAVISKQKKQVWLTEEEYDKLMELLKPKPYWNTDSLLIRDIWDSLIVNPNRIDINWGLADSTGR